MRILRAVGVAAVAGLAVLLVPASPASAAVTASPSATCSGGTVKVTVQLSNSGTIADNVEVYINGVMEFQQSMAVGDNMSANGDVSPPKDVPVKVTTGYDATGKTTVLDTTVKNPCAANPTAQPTGAPTGAPNTGGGASQDTDTRGIVTGAGAVVLAGGLGAGLFLVRRRRRAA